ncbi:G2/mitotic-specific cyclin-B1-like [Cololabis saira]|uniref:G2/mitotic-specific cyclin-B1-like n=1 Tax=Cololabis saira TaxID=129043 RepID=UPI002AD5421E|nr:G2/mitotic-specific cyclin-B1-like [Cololabis saira]
MPGVVGTDLPGKTCSVAGPTQPRVVLGQITSVAVNRNVQKKNARPEAAKKAKVITKPNMVFKPKAVVCKPKTIVIPAEPAPEIVAQPEPASPTPMETAGCEAVDL